MIHWVGQPTVPVVGSDCRFQPGLWSTSLIKNGRTHFELYWKSGRRFVVAGLLGRRVVVVAAAVVVVAADFDFDFVVVAAAIVVFAADVVVVVIAVVVVVAVRKAQSAPESLE